MISAREWVGRPFCNKQSNPVCCICDKQKCFVYRINFLNEPIEPDFIQKIKKIREEEAMEIPDNH